MDFHTNFHIDSVNIHLYGPVKYNFNPNAKLSENTVIKLPFVLNETVEKHFKKDTPEHEENSMPLEQINQEEIRDILFNSVKPRVEELVAKSASAYLAKLGL